MAFESVTRGGVTGAPLHLCAARAGSRMLARVRGPLASSQGAPLLAEVREACRRHRRLVLDLRGAEYIDSDGVRALMALQAEAEKLRIDLRLVLQPSSRVERTLRTLELLGTFATSASVAPVWRRVRTPS